MHKVSGVLFYASFDSQLQLAVAVSSLQPWRVHEEWLILPDKLLLIVKWVGVHCHHTMLGSQLKAKKKRKQMVSSDETCPVSMLDSTLSMPFKHASIKVCLVLSLLNASVSSRRCHIADSEGVSYSQSSPQPLLAAPESVIKHTNSHTRAITRALMFRLHGGPAQWCHYLNSPHHRSGLD